MMLTVLMYELASGTICLHVRLIINSNNPFLEAMCNSEGYQSLSLDERLNIMWPLQEDPDII